MDYIFTNYNYFICNIFYSRFLWFKFSQQKTISNSVIQVREHEKAKFAKAPKYSFAHAVSIAIPSVVNINTSIKIRYSPNPFFEDPFFRKFFGDQFDYQQEKQTSSLGSGVLLVTTVM